MSHEVLQQALQYVESNSFGGSDTFELIAALREALAQPEQTHSQNPKFTTDEWAAHARKHQWRFDEEPVTGVTTLAQPEQEYDNGFSNGWNKCEERQATAQPAESDYVESLMTLVYDFARAYEHDKDGSYLVKGQKLEAEKKLRAAIAQPVQPEQEPVAWVWNPVNEAWERVHVFGYWQQGAIYAFGPTMPGAPQPEQNARK